MAYRCRLEWGRRGTSTAAQRGDILVIVDTLSFSTAVVTAVQGGGLIYPCPLEEDLTAFAQRTGAEVAVHRRAVPEKGRFSLSPLTYQDIKVGTKVVLASPNGATCARYAQQVPYLFVGALVNAEAVASAVSSVLDAQSHNLGVTIIACGERWKTPSEDGVLRMAVEDYLAAGAILSYLPQEKSAEARVCAGAFLQARDNLEALLWECESGQELREMGFAGDVLHAARLNLYNCVPIMRNERLEPFS